MCYRYAFEAVDKTMRDILRFSNEDATNRPFGGKVVVLGGDFRQILPVMAKGTRQDIIHAAINSSPLWRHCKVLRLTRNIRLKGGISDSEIEDLRNFSEWMLGIGEGLSGRRLTVK
jgi:ATP-dependent DNA helicase PIF1